MMRGVFVRSMTLLHDPGARDSYSVSDIPIRIFSVPSSAATVTGPVYSSPMVVGSRAKRLLLRGQVGACVAQGSLNIERTNLIDSSSTPAINEAGRR